MLPVFWSYAFRPFFLVGSLFAFLSSLFWGFSFFKGIFPTWNLGPFLWHAHEMLFGFVSAIIVGFLLTAAASWAKAKPVSGIYIKILLLAWLLGRLAFLAPIFHFDISPTLIFILDISFLPLAAIFIAPTLYKTKVMRNFQFIPIFFVMTLGNVLIHLSSMEVIPFKYGKLGTYLVLNLIVVIMAVIGGRVIPLFTKNTMKLETKKWDLLENLILVFLWAYIVCDFFFDGTIVHNTVTLISGLLLIMRMAGWKSCHIAKKPLLWILHLGHLFIGIGFILVFLSNVFYFIPHSSAIHAFTAGAMGILIIGMISRVSLGHTGRVINLPKGFVAAYFCVILAALIRIISAFTSKGYSHGILTSAILWGVGFLMFFIYYYKILITPRADGK